MRTRIARWTVATAAAAAIIMSVAFLAERSRGGFEAGPAAKPQARDLLPVRVYDIADLISVRRDSRQHSRMHPVVEFASPVKTSETIIQTGTNIRETRRTFDPSRYSEVQASAVRDVVAAMFGRELAPDGDVHLVGRVITVRQTEAVHRKVQQFLADLRKQLVDVPTVTVRARWVRLTAEQLAKIAGAPGATSPPRVPAAVLKEAAEFARGSIACLDRQTVRLLTGRAETVISDVDMPVTKGVTGLDPLISDILWGPALDVTPVLAADGRSVTVNVVSVASRRRKITRVKLSLPKSMGRRPAGDLAVDVLEYDVDTFATTASLPLGEAVLIAGGLVADPPGGGGVHLVLTVTAPAPAKGKP